MAISGAVLLCPPLSLSALSSLWGYGRKDEWEEAEKAGEGAAVKYGDVFAVTGELAEQPVAPGDAAMMQRAEHLVTGHTQKGGPASIMQSAAAHNERAGFVRHRDVVGRRCEPTPVGPPLRAANAGSVTIGEALEVAALVAGDEAVEQSDAAAIQAAEARATGLHETPLGGVAAVAQSAAEMNAHTQWQSGKTTLREVLTGATEKMVADKAATMEDAEKVAAAELRNNPETGLRQGGVAATVMAAARLNEARLS
ncbi:unnamed protein product [Spirodela intermedia]|uniref:SMP domain-containing protein n=1 Tax=Spirodela intermedia TaxID=51605 RepID=A0A7I8IXP5_SPIIN|nr:unnamed protein product [Spirodela intermedia]CAA6662786.1 unnamed protein product [Spirodela intermedia]